MTENTSDFEKTLKKLEEASEKLKEKDVPLDEAIRQYEEGIKYYRQCSEILAEAGRKIETLSK